MAELAARTAGVRAACAHCRPAEAFRREIPALPVLGELCVDKNLPAGDPCWQAAMIGSYVVRASAAAPRHAPRARSPDALAASRRRSRTACPATSAGAGCAGSACGARRARGSPRRRNTDFSSAPTQLRGVPDVQGRLPVVSVVCRRRRVSFWAVPRKVIFCSRVAICGELVELAERVSGLSKRAGRYVEVDVDQTSA